MAGESAVDRAAMAVAANQTQDAVDQIRGQQTKMNANHSALMGGWNGQAATAFTAAFDSFNNDFTKVLTALQGMQERLVGTQKNYTVTEQANTQAASRISGLLNR